MIKVVALRSALRSAKPARTDVKEQNSQTATSHNFDLSNSLGLFKVLLQPLQAV